MDHGAVVDGEEIRLGLFGGNRRGFGLLLGIAQKQVLGNEEGRLEAFEPRPFYAGTGTSAHFDEIAPDVIVPDGIEHLDAAVEPVHRHALIVRAGRTGDGAEDAAGRGIEAADGLVHFGRIFVRLGDADFFPLQPILKLFKHQNRVDVPPGLGLLLLGDAGAHEHHLDVVTVGLFHHPGMGHRRGNHRRDEGNELGIVFLHQHH